MTRLTIPRGLLASGINSYSEEGHAQKQAFHADGKKFLAALAKALGYVPGDYDLRSNIAGMAVSGEVTLHSDHLYVQLSESCMHPGVQVLYRACSGRKDYTGKTNHFAKMADLRSTEAQALVLRTMRGLIEQAAVNAAA
jgi:hypothetical protein